MSMKVKSHYSTKDMGLVATLACNGIHAAELKCVDPNRHRYMFVFERTEELQKVVDSFYDGKALVNPVELLQQVRMIKAKIEGQNNTGGLSDAP